MVPWTRTSTGQRRFAVYGPKTRNRLPTALRSPELSLASFKRQIKTHSSVPALDSAGCSCGCRVPSSGAVVTVQRVRRRLQMSRLDWTRCFNGTCSEQQPTGTLLVWSNPITLAWYCQDTTMYIRRYAHVSCRKKTLEWLLQIWSSLRCISYTHLQTLHIITGDNNAMHHQDKHKYQGLLFSHTSTITSVRVVEKEQGGARKFCSIEELID